MVSLLLGIFLFFLGTRWGSPSGPAVCHTDYSWWNPLGPLGRRDAALAELTNNWWTATLDPTVLPWLAQQRRAPFMLIGGVMVAGLQIVGLPWEACLISLGGIFFAGQSFPELMDSNIGRYSYPYYSAWSDSAPYPHFIAPAYY